jgi:trimeric autotransporter adhesin
MSNRRILGAIILGFILAVAIIGGATELDQYILTTNTPSTIAPGTGILAAQITDPQNLPSGVTSVYVNCSPIQVHAAGVSLKSGWYTVTNSASIDLTKLTTQSATIGSAEVTSGVFNLANLSISGATVTFNGANYTATVISRVITIPISNGGALVRAGSSSGFVIDFSLTILKLHSDTGTGFGLETVATSLAIPQHDWSPKLASPGAKEDVNATSWGTSISREVAESSFEITGASLQGSSIFLTVKNNGKTNLNMTSLSLLFVGTSLSPYPMVSVSISNSTSTTSVANTTAPSSTSITTTVSANSTKSASTNSSTSTSTSTTTTSVTNTTTTSSIATSSTTTNFSTSMKIQTGPELIAEFNVLPSCTLAISNGTLTSGCPLSPGRSVTLAFHGSLSSLPNLFGGTPLLISSGQVYEFSLLTDAGVTSTFEYTVP